ncbi:TfoX/Sxy family protein [Pyruvatibacter mobilis]|uniref:TfoX/Sxy family protein n=1 Tax=Pyruvatibacter mobilis TaxID=1712261 RepID=UPI003D0C3B0E
MPVSADYTDFLIEMLAPLGPVTSRRMFGGAGLFADGLMFGLIVNDVLYFKVDGENRAAFEEEGMEVFSYARSGKQASLSYWRVPERLFDDPEEFVDWARDAMSVALRADAAKPPSQRKKQSA